MLDFNRIWDFRSLSKERARKALVSSIEEVLKYPPWENWPSPGIEAHVRLTKKYLAALKLEPQENPGVFFFTYLGDLLPHLDSDLKEAQEFAREWQVPMVE